MRSFIERAPNAHWLAGFVVAAGLALWPAVAEANTGIPMLAFAWPAAWLTFVPVVLVEGLVARRVLGLRTTEAMKLSLCANGWSTMVGLPLTWIALVALEMPVGIILGSTGGAPSPLLVAATAPFFAAWLPPTGAGWAILAAGAFLCVPFFFASVLVEAKVAAARVPAKHAARWARSANRLTYGVILLLLLLATLHQVV